MRKTVLFGLIALFASLAPAFAGEVYVPFASNKLINGSFYRTKVWVTNTGAATQRCDVKFIEAEADGTKVTTAPTPVNVAGGATVVLSNVAPVGKNGLLELVGASTLVVTSRLEVVGLDDAILGTANVPVVGVGNVIGAKKVAEVQGLELTQRGTTTDFGIVNLNRTSTQCTVKGFRSNNTQIAQTVVISLAPLSVRHFDQALSILGESSIADVRMEVTCDKQFYPYALVYKPGSAETAFMLPSETLEGDLVPGSGSPSGDSIVVQQQGVFLAAKQGASYKAVVIPLVNGVQYKKVTMEFDLATGRYPAGIFSGITSMRRNDKTLFFGMIVRPDRDKTVLDMGVTDDVVLGANGSPWKEHTNFHLWFEYNTETRTLTFKVFRNGALVQNLTGRTNHNDLSLNGRVFTVDFGMAGIADGAYFPPIGWTYSNLKVVVEP